MFSIFEEQASQAYNPKPYKEFDNSCNLESHSNFFDDANYRQFNLNPGHVRENNDDKNQK